MASLEDRLRSELRQAGDRLDPATVGPLRVPSRRRTPGLVRWLAPVTAMAAVMAVIAGVQLTRPAARPDSASSAGMPPYYVTVGYAPADSPAQTGAVTATVHASATGQTLSSIQLPAGSGDVENVQLISAAADDRTFIIEDLPQLFVLRVGAGGRSPRVSILAGSFPSPTAVALSPDGSMVAVESMFDCDIYTSYQGIDVPGCENTQLELLSVKTRTYAGGIWETYVSTPEALWISWTRASQILFLWPGSDATLRVLDVSDPGDNDLLDAQVLPVHISYDDSGAVPYTFMTSDGSAIISSAVSAASMQVVEYSALTGRLLHVLASYGVPAHYPEGSPSPGCKVLSLAPVALHALILCVTPSIVFGRLDDGRFTRLPGITDSSGTAAW
jgi:hypothetical protein